ncbi:MAG: hypothetical protein PWP54_27 [Thermosipho sp. (in: thermotogales)]|nr:hypothetical protein [Thermosipho sp. (in: thermotogales)]MDN5324317.1 hypothetical protein [Thermosipho sp. (in: thermotogales)]
MKCSRCGKLGERFYKVHIDGVEKHISLCKKCLLETIKYDVSNYVGAGVELLSAHITFAEEIKTKYNPKNLITNNLEILTLMPLAIQTVLFKSDELTKARMIKEINNRQIFFLKQRLKKALKNENYELASILKKQIEHLENMSEI